MASHDMTMCPLLQDGCSSFDIALEVGKKIESLQVETCEAFSEEDKKLNCSQIRVLFFFRGMMKLSLSSLLEEASARWNFSLQCR